jgi:hypothetical protein
MPTTNSNNDIEKTYFEQQRDLVLQDVASVSRDSTPLFLKEQTNNRNKVMRKGKRDYQTANNKIPESGTSFAKHEYVEPQS